jgi:hypothetical protein
LIWCLLGAILWTVADGTLASGATEPELKAAYIYKFLGFVKYPSASGRATTIGILGDDSVGGALTAMDAKLNVKRSRRIEDLKGCQVLFIPNSERGNIGGILASLSGMNVLTIGESDGFAGQGGIIGFVKEADKLHFEINAGAARRAGLTIDSQLLKLAVRVFNQ